MELFEIHITSDTSVHKIAANFFNVKTISVELLRPDLSVIRVEHMTSFIRKFKSFDECLASVKLMETAFNVIRSKIECPPYSHYMDTALYTESHFPVSPKDASLFPVSRNVRSGKLIGTKREYNKNKFMEFITETKYDIEIELCLYDTNINEDSDWLDYWGKQ